MRTKFYFLAASLCCMLPFMVQGVDLDANDPPPGPPRAPIRSVYSPVIVETESGMLTLHFRSDLGKINVSLQEVTGATEENTLVDTSIRSQIVWFASAGSYVLTITDAAGNVLKQDIVEIP